jgi:hypothetical protein
VVGDRGCDPGFPAGVAPERGDLLFWVERCLAGRKEGPVSLVAGRGWLMNTWDAVPE